MFFEKILKKKFSHFPKRDEKFWNISVGTAYLFYLLVTTRKIKSILEVGTSNAFSTLFFAQALNDNAFGGTITTIESNSARYESAKKNIEKSGLSCFVNQIKGHAPEAFAHIQTPFSDFDLIFFDATKHEYKNYWKFLKNKIKKNSLLIADNAISHQHGMKDFLSDISSDADLSFKLLSVGSGLAVVEKIR